MKNWFTNKDGELNHPVIIFLIFTVIFVGYSFYKNSFQSEAAPPSADLSVSKTDGVSSVTSGGTTTYTITVSNAGPFPSDGAIVTDAAATGLSKTGSATCSGSGGASCTASFPATDLESGFAITTFPAGGSVDITFTANVTALSGSVVNSASVAGVASLDPNPGNDSASDTDTVTSTDIDCGFRGYDSSAATSTVAFACESGTPTSPLRIRKNGTTYGVILVPTGDANASHFRVQTSSTIKAIKKF